MELEGLDAGARVELIDKITVIESARARIAAAQQEAERQQREANAKPGSKHRR